MGAIQIIKGLGALGKFNQMKVNPDGSLDSRIQDQTTPPVLSYFNRVTNQTTLTASPSIGDTVINVASATGISAGSYIILFNAAAARFSFMRALSVATLAVTIDTPVDFAYPIGSPVDVAVTNMNVTGSLAVPITYGLRGVGTPPGVDLEFDLTRIIFQFITATTVNDLSDLGDIAGITNGLVLRRRDGEYRNYFNVKKNGDLVNLAFDYDSYASFATGNGGLGSRLTFAGQNKMGVALRLGIGEDLEFLVQDDLSGLTELQIIAEGHIVQD